MNVFLEQRFSAGDLDKAASKLSHFRQNFIDRSLFAFEERIFSVALRTADIAIRQADENTRSSHIARLTLDAVKNLVDDQRVRVLLYRMFVDRLFHLQNIRITRQKRKPRYPVSTSRSHKPLSALCV